MVVGNVLKFCMPRTVGLRGAGLANELNGWAKAYIASRVLNARLLQPAWGLNRRHYWRYFGASRTDWAYQALLRTALATFEITSDDFEDRYDQDFRTTVTRYAERHDLRSRTAYVVRVGGMWGGIGVLREAFPYIYSRILSSRNTVDNLAELQLCIPSEALTIAVHVRRGDFIATDQAAAAHGPRWNIALSLDWYIAVCRSLSEQLSVPHRFLLFSDASLSRLRRLIAAVDPVTTAHQSYNVCSDLLAMANADILVTSCSSFSAWAAALSGRPYIWHADNVIDAGGEARLWDHGRPLSGYLAATPRGVMVDGSGDVPAKTVRAIEAGHTWRGWGNDLVFYGSVKHR